MRYIALLLFFFSTTLMAQNIDVRFDQSIHDYGYIKEADGKVYTEFEFQNYSKFPVSIYKVISSCGCAIATADDKWIQPNAKGKISVSYDPDGRPGKFVKSFEVIFISDSLKKTSFLNIRGYTIEKELLETYVDNLYEGTELMIKPFKTNILSETDHRFLGDEYWQHFINDITYEIDQNGFANAMVELSVISQKDCKGFGKNIYPVVHRNIINELERRKYKSWSIGFKDTCKVSTLSDGVLGADLKVASVNYSNDTISESGFYFSGKEVNHDKFSLSKTRDSSEFEKKIIKRFSFINKKSLDPDKNKDYAAFLNLVNRKILVDKSVFLGFSIEVKCRNEDQDKIRQNILKQLKELMGVFQKHADETGAVLSRMNFSVPEINFIKDSTQKPGKFIQRIWNLMLFHPEKLNNETSNPFEDFVKMDSTGAKKLKDFLTQTGFKAPYQNLPVLELEHTGSFSFDSTTLLIKSWVNILKEEWKNGNKIDLLIESSVGRTLHSALSDREFLSRKNAKIISEDFKKLLLKIGIPDSLVKISIVSTIVQGSDYTGKEFDLQFNQKYNYLKIIPIFSKLPQDLKVALIPYQISFNNNSFELPVKTAIFQNFISRLVLVLENEGWINLIVESSSSKIPSTIYKSNELLSFFRAEDAVQKIKNEIHLRGYDPSRILITEMRTLVQGPEFKNENDRKLHPYEKYQYVKIIPTALIKK